MEPLLYSARFACPGMLTFANFEYSGTPGKALRSTLNAFGKECPGVGAVAKGRCVWPSLAVCHISGSQIFGKSRFLQKRVQLKIVSKIDLTGSRRVRRFFFKNAGQYSPLKIPSLKGGATFGAAFVHCQICVSGNAHFRIF